MRNFIGLDLNGPISVPAPTTSPPMRVIGWMDRKCYRELLCDSPKPHRSFLLEGPIVSERFSLNPQHVKCG